MRRPQFLSGLPPLAVDFSGRRTTTSTVGIALLVAGIAVAASAALDVAAAEERAQAAAERVEALRQAIKRQSRPKHGAATANAAGADEIRVAQRIAAAIATPWEAVLRELEEAAGPDIALLALDAEAKNRTLRLSGEAASAEAAFAYAARLGESDHFDEVALVSHEEKQVGATSVFSFTLAIVWGPGT